MSETITLARGLDMETLRSRDNWRYLLDPSLPVREPTEAEAKTYAERQADGTYAALLDGPVTEPDGEDAYTGTGWTAAEVDAVLAENARRTYAEYVAATDADLPGPARRETLCGPDPIAGTGADRVEPSGSRAMQPHASEGRAGEPDENAGGGACS